MILVISAATGRASSLAAFSSAAFSVAVNLAICWGSRLKIIGVPPFVDCPNIARRLVRRDHFSFDTLCLGSRRTVLHARATLPSWPRNKAVSASQSRHRKSARWRNANRRIGASSPEKTSKALRLTRSCPLGFRQELHAWLVAIGLQSIRPRVRASCSANERA